MKKVRFLSITFTLFLQGLSSAHAVIGRTEIQYTSPNGLTEKCIPLASIPGGKYTDSDFKKEDELCAVNFYENTVALCPKEKSTSPGTYVYSLAGLNDLNFHQKEAENQCAKTDRLAFKVGTFKQTMNQATTSATNSLSSLLYYHFSRYFNTMVKVPASVYRTMDKNTHYVRVAKKAHGMGSMNEAGWKFMREAEEHPDHYNERLRLFTDDFKQIFGVLLKAKGERYGSYFFETRESGWKSQYMDFKAAPPFMAVKSSSDLKTAIKEAISTINKSHKIASEVGFFPSSTQMVHWMINVNETAVLDYIFSQQDRVGNIDYIWTWAFVYDGKVHYRVLDDKYKKFTRVAMSKANIPLPEDIKDLNPFLVQRTVLGDNDAGALLQYANYTKKFEMLEDMRHMSSELYNKLQALNLDFKKKGPLYQYAAKSIGMLEKDLNQFVINVDLAASTLKRSCKLGLLRFDLNSKSLVSIMSNGDGVEESVSCE